MCSEIILDSNAIISNFRKLRSLTPSRYKLISVLKGNAYGHGLREIARILEAEADGFQVSDANELKELRSATSKPIYVLGYIPHHLLEESMKLSPVISVFDTERLPAINSIAYKLGIRQKVHIKIDALVGRLGILESEFEKYSKNILEYANIEVSGIYTHFTGLKDEINMEHTRNQISQFEKCVNTLKRQGIQNLEVHASSSAGIFIDEIISNELFNLIRIGKAQYGIWPSKGIPQDINLEPVLSWKTEIAQIKTLPGNYPIGYTAMFKTNQQSRIAVIPQGYSDGYDKQMSANAEVLIKGHRCKILGKAAMNMFIADVSWIENSSQGDEVVLIGKQGSEEIKLPDLAKWANVTECEVLSRISPRLQRKII